MNKISLLKCEDYVLEDVISVIKESFVNLGGIEKFINKGDKVLLKINLVMRKTKEEAATTHPVFVEALARVLLEYGAEVIIGDSPGGPFNAFILKDIYRYCGITEVAEKSGAVLNYNVETGVVDNQEAEILKHLITCNMLKDAHKVISVSKLKTHSMATFTGAVKNMFGIIPGVLKAEYHLNLPETMDFANALVDICLYANPVLSFMDGIIGMEGAGPTAGTPKWAGVVIASNSPYHLDVCACKVISLDPKAVPTIINCIRRGIVKEDFSDMDIVGNKIEDVRTKFLVPDTRIINPLKNKLPVFLGKPIENLLKTKPVIHKEKCIGCRVCSSNCPPRAIQMINNKPIVDLDKCIRCYCCQELCASKAITVSRPLLRRLIK